MIVKQKLARQITGAAAYRNAVPSGIQAKHTGGPAGWSDQIEKDSDRRCFPGPVWAEKSKNLTRSDIEIQLRNPTAATVEFGKIMDCDNRAVHSVSELGKRRHRRMGTANLHSIPIQSFPVKHNLPGIACFSEPPYVFSISQGIAG